MLHASAIIRRQRITSHAAIVLPFLVLAALAGTMQGVAAQTTTGRIVGRILDASTGQGIADAGIQVVGTTLGTQSKIDGRYALAQVPAGTITLHVRLLGYRPKTVTGIMLDAGTTLEQNITLEEARLELDAVVVTAAVERGSVSALLDEQRNATGVVSAVGAEQIARSPDGDAAQVVRRVSGVTVQDDRYVFVRGLGERYTTTALNGVRVPSPEPEKKVVPLDLFPSGLIESITTAKTFTPDQPGDFSGAQVDIRMRNVPARPVMSYSITAGYNDAATGQRVLAAPTLGLDWLAFGGTRRELPGAITAYGPRLPGDLSRDEQNRLVNAFRNAWTPQGRSGAPNYSASLSAGGEVAPGGHGIGYVGSLSYAATQEVRRDEERAVAVPVSQQPLVLQPYNAYRGSTGRSSVLWGGLLNLTTWLGGHTKVTLSNMYDRTADNEAHLDAGMFQEETFIQRAQLRYVERSVRSNQLQVEHDLGANQSIAWSVASSGVSRSEPDRADLTYAKLYDGATNDTLPLALFSRPDANKRTFGTLDEHAWSGAVHYTVSFGVPTHPITVKAGGAYRETHRDADQEAFEILTPGLSQEQREAPAEEIFDGRYAKPGDTFLTLTPSQSGGSYTVTERIPAGYGMIEYPLGDRVRLVAGARVEHWSLSLRADDIISGSEHVTRNLTDVLPSAIVNVTLTESQTLRLAASQTISRPEYRELASVTYRGGLSDQLQFGNPALQRALIRNYDARWEWYPNPGEALSLALFAKQFDHPIEQVDVATSGASQLSFINARSGFNYGVELEVRKDLGAFASWLAPLHLFANGTFMTSEIDVTDSTRSALTNDTRAMVGQAPYVVNTGLTYLGRRSAVSATVLYNVVGRRIYAAGSTPLPDTYEMPRHVLDVSLRVPLSQSIAGKLDAKNLLDAPHELKQGNVIRERYTVGRSFSFGLSWSR
jgi:hypothetical protein